jgi:hypothetical protein
MMAEWIFIAWVIKYFLDKRIRYIKPDYYLEQKK